MSFGLAAYENIKKEGGERDINHSSEQRGRKNDRKVKSTKRKSYRKLKVLQLARVVGIGPLRFLFCYKRKKKKKKKKEK